MRILKILTLCLAMVAPAAMAGPLSITLAPASKNPSSPQMGDHLSFQSVLRNTSGTTVDGLVAWISLVQFDRAKEQPVDLEDWSAHKAVAVRSLAPGATVETDWPMRLIQAGHYRVAISVANRDGSALLTSPFVSFTVRQKPVVESARVLPVALGMPLGLTALWLWRLPRHTRKARASELAPTR
ncbi:MAG: hypothetical protein KDK91_07100 [Gammaproteobacteria bacterium]|nr:hypothetical protein [Gammaproteobacteria bacterium]